MPRYSYRCVECLGQFNAFHGFSETASCPKCDSTLCERIPSIGFSVSGTNDPSTKKQKVGQKVNDFIREAKEELKEQRKTLEEGR